MSGYAAYVTFMIYNSQISQWVHGVPSNTLESGKSGFSKLVYDQVIKSRITMVH